jgi:hypothetical protein
MTIQNKDLAPGEHVLWRNIKRHLFFGHTTQIMEVTEKSIVLWIENPPLNVRIPNQTLTDIVIVNQKYNSIHYSYGGAHTYGGGFSGPRMYMGQSTGNTVGDIQMFSGSHMVMEWRGLADPAGIRNLIKAEMR